MIELSVIIPTRNRAIYLKDAVGSILCQTMAINRYEIIVVDNGSTDNTKELINQINNQYGNGIRYFYEPTPGLHVGRHLGAKESQSSILVYADDDIIAFPEWLEAIHSAFSEPSVVLVGGINLPKWEDKIPDWVDLFWNTVKYGWTNGYLSLLDFGDKQQEIPAYYVYGCNFSIRKSIMYECGGFHPDSMPQELIRFRGDGETGLCMSLMKKGYKTIYEPKAAIYHRVPPERLTIEYFCRRAFNQGISDSYTHIRQEHNRQFNLSLVRKLAAWGKSILVEKKQTDQITERVQHSYDEGYQYHQGQVAIDPALLAFVLQDKYYE